MDKKKLERILGILVIIALVILLFPLLSGGKNEVPTEQAANVNPPPFPEQQSAIPSVRDETGQEPTPSSLESKASEPYNPIQETQDNNGSSVSHINAVDTNSADNSILTAMNLDTAQESSIITIAKDPNDSEKMSVTVNNDKLGNNDKSAANEETISKETTLSNDQPTIIKKPLDTKPKNSAKKAQITKKEKPTHLTHKDLLKFNKKAWVIQMGSFKDKRNARHLADTLRAAGYKAFIQEVKSSNGSIRLRVYVGPEFQQASAVNLSAKIKQEMMLHGIVVSYKPLTL